MVRQSGVRKKKQPVYTTSMKTLPQVEQYLIELGLNQGVAKLYLELARTHQPSVLGLAKSLNISRAQVYRQLDILCVYNLVSMEKLSHGTIYRALPLDNMESIIEDRQANLDKAKRDLDTMTQMMREFVAHEDDQSVVRHYYGVNGLKQANWNLTKAKNKYYVFESASLQEHFSFDLQFAYRCNERFAQRQLVSYDLTNNSHPRLEDMVPLDITRVNYRYLDPAVLTINFEIYLYNDTLTLLEYDPSNRHAIEITHPILFRMMRQLYDIAWQMGTPIKLSTQAELCKKVW